MLPSILDVDISVEDVDQIARVMQKDFSDPERIDAIRFLGCGDINACPGSGKTTTMVAKLLILSKKLEGKKIGICALSHTNAAKTEIQKSLGPHSIGLMRYPHFIGTLQSFFDLFLAIPEYIEEFGHRPTAVDDDLFRNFASRSYSLIDRNVLYGIQRRDENLLNKVSFRFSNFDPVKFEDNQEVDLYCGPTTRTYKEILRWKREITSLGYLTYHDAFAYANRHLQRYPHLINIISRRFSYVFIDEMQDTDSFQNELIERIFRNRCIIQRFGDPNQAIYGQRSQRGSSIWQPDELHLIRTSKRLSLNISQVSQGISCNPHTIIGNSNIPNHSPVMILFSELRRHGVIPKFGQLIEDLQLQDGPFKALGAVGRPNPNPAKLSITSYWPNFEHKLHQSKFINPFWGIIGQIQTSLRIDKGYAEPFHLFSKAFTELLRIQNIRSPEGYLYNSNQLVKRIRETGAENFNVYKSLILSNIEKLITGKKLEPDALINQAKFVFSLLQIRTNEQCEDIIRNNLDSLPPTYQEPTSAPNIYVHSPQISVEVDTIHAAKGQTHQATLLLETCFHQNDLNTIFPYLVGQSVENPGERIRTRYLPLTYVACTRPTHLLCLAIQRDQIDNIKIAQLEEFGWQIEQLS